MLNYLSAFRTILRRVHGERIESLSSSVLTADLAEKFFSSHVREAGEDLLLRDKRIRGANSNLTNARAIFSDQRVYRGLQLPDLTGFLKAETMRNPELKHKHLAQETVWEIAQAATWLRDAYPELYLAHLMYRHLGMRNIEILNARPEWIERRSEEVFLPNGEKREIAAVMAIKKRSYFEPKASAGDVPIAPDVLAELELLMKGLGPQDYLIRAESMKQRIQTVYHAHNDFMRP